MFLGARASETASVFTSNLEKKSIYIYVATFSSFFLQVNWEKSQFLPKHLWSSLELWLKRGSPKTATSFCASSAATGRPSVIM